jgi:hypothetical protein
MEEEKKSGFLTKVKDKIKGASSGMNDMFGDAMFDMLKPMIEKAIPKVEPKIKAWFKGLNPETMEQEAKPRIVILELIEKRDENGNVVVEELMARIFKKNMVKIMEAKIGEEVALEKVEFLKDIIIAMGMGDFSKE